MVGIWQAAGHPPSWLRLRRMAVCVREPAKSPAPSWRHGGRARAGSVPDLLSAPPDFCGPFSLMVRGLAQGWASGLVGAAGGERSRSCPAGGGRTRAAALAAAGTRCCPRGRRAMRQGMAVVRRHAGAGGSGGLPPDRRRAAVPPASRHALSGICRGRPARPVVVLHRRSRPGPAPVSAPRSRAVRASRAAAGRAAGPPPPHRPRPCSRGPAGCRPAQGRWPRRSPR